MSELAGRLLAVIRLGPIGFNELWCWMLDDTSSVEMLNALAELKESGMIEQIDATFAFKAA